MLVNTKSGRGKSAMKADLLSRLLLARGHLVETIAVQRFYSQEQGGQADLLASMDRVVIVGGDGTVHHMLGLLCDVPTPMFHLGTGTANLIGKELGMSREPKVAIKQIEADHQPRWIDVPTVNGLPFLLMVSLGLDASVIHRFEELRSTKSGAGGGYLAYLRPILSELVSPRLAHYSWRIQDKGEPANADGLMVISNMKSYGGQFNPNPQARCDDAKLDGIVIPCRNTLAAALAFFDLRFRLNPPRAHRFQFTNDLIIRGGQAPSPVQVDGEQAGGIPGLTNGLLMPDQEIRICAGQRRLIVQSERGGNERGNVR